MDLSELETECEGFKFVSKFDSANLAKVEFVPRKVEVQESPKSKSKSKNHAKPPKIRKVPSAELPDYEFNLWTNHDCSGTEFENSNRTWFYFGIRGGPPFSLVKLNLMNLNKQGRMYREGMAPVCRIHPNRSWERIRDKPQYSCEDNIFTLSFKFNSLENPRQTIYFAFTYPFSYSEMLAYLDEIDKRYNNISQCISKSEMRLTKGFRLVMDSRDSIYYHREILCYSLENRRVDLITISSHHGITTEREPRLKNLFPDKNKPRPYVFQEKKVVLISARVHPGETPSSFVFNGFLNLLMSADLIAVLLRRHFVFKLIPILNPDGVARGHYRTDTRGVNLNRYYLNPSFSLHPSIYAARSLIRYHHFGAELNDEGLNEGTDDSTLQDSGSSTSDSCTQELTRQSSRTSLTADLKPSDSSFNSGLFLYMDLHGHASKKGIFIYGNHFDHVEDRIECMLFPKLMSLNSQHFHFNSCNFTERNMYLKDKRDGTSREGSGRVAVSRLTGLVRSYTLECNYNTGRFVNVLPPCFREVPGTAKSSPAAVVPPKYSPTVYEEVGRAIGPSLLDLINANPLSRVPNSDFHSMAGIKEWLKLKATSESIVIRTKTSLRSRDSNDAPQPAQGVHRESKLIGLSPKLPRKSSDTQDSLKKSSALKKIKIGDLIVKKSSTPSASEILSAISKLSPSTSSPVEVGTKKRVFSALKLKKGLGKRKSEEFVKKKKGLFKSLSLSGMGEGSALRKKRKP